MASFLNQALHHLLETTLTTAAERCRLLRDRAVRIAEPPPGARLVTDDALAYSGVAIVDDNEVVLMISTTVRPIPTH